jgi:NAD(P)-dependent dehydrogenase (short-subunit alcohol dehydrogenase family)
MTTQWSVPRLVRLPIPAGADDVTPDWLTAALNETGALRGVALPSWSGSAWEWSTASPAWSYASFCGTSIRRQGHGHSAPLGSITEEQFDFIFGVNAKGVLFTVQAALPRLAEGGTVVIIGSTASTEAEYGMSLYGGSKAAIRQFVRGWISEVKERGIRINVLSPGAIDTPSLRTALAGASGEENVEREVKRMGEGNPLGRLGDPREIGKVVVFLSSDASSFVTGVELFVDGGMAQIG